MAKSTLEQLEGESPGTGAGGGGEPHQAAPLPGLDPVDGAPPAFIPVGNKFQPVERYGPDQPAAPVGFNPDVPTPAPAPAPCGGQCGGHGGPAAPPAAGPGPGTGEGKGEGAGPAGVLAGVKNALAAFPWWLVVLVVVLLLVVLFSRRGS